MEKSPFLFTATVNDIQVNNLKFAPGEISTVANLLGWARRMSRLKTLPPKIKNAQFEIRFFPNRVLTLTRIEPKEEEIEFTFEDVDELIEGLQNMINSHIDLNKLGSQKKGIKVVDHLSDETSF